jgi:hypothetical protein
MPKRARKPFELSLSDEKREDLALELARALDEALAVRGVVEQEVEYFHTLYEQGRTRGAQNSPWADAADLTSYLGTFYVDVLRAMIVDTVMTEPVWTVEGYGPAAQNAPFVEEFHQWQQEAEGFQQAFSKAVHLSLIEPRGVLEVYEDTIKRPVRKVIKAALQLNPLDGSALVDEKLKPVLQRDPMGNYVEVFDPMQPSAEVEIDSYETVCRGPRERTIPYRDFLVLPGHARDKSEIWGYAKRFHRRLDDILERVEAGIYDKHAVQELGTDDERPSDTTLAGDPQGVASKDGTAVVEKELWELLFLRDLDGKGLRWYVATLSKDKQQLLRIQYDDIGRPRYFPLIPFPKPNSTEGYSYIGHKLITVIEEHTAWRNMLADRASLQLQAPIKKVQGALWDPDSEPIGPKAVITVRRADEVMPMEFPDATGPAVERIRDAERAGERLSGINDASAGITSEDKRTLGEVELISRQSAGRVNEVVKNLQETLEEVAQVRHLMWKRALAEMGAEGMPAPPSVAQSLSNRMQPPMNANAMMGSSGALMGLEQRVPDVAAVSPDFTFTAQMMEGTFRFKPRGSVETADKNRLRYDMSQGFQSITAVAQVNPMVAALLATPMAAKAMIEQWVRLYNVQDKQAFVGSEALTAALQAVQMQAMAAAQAPPGEEGPPANEPPAQGFPA